MKMLDLFSGSGAASRAQKVRGWDVVRFDCGEGTAADHRFDLAEWSPADTSRHGDRVDLVWASPPCTQLSTASRARNVDEGLHLVRVALHIIESIRPRWWVLENVHGATRAIGGLLGPPVAQYGSFYLWGNFPPFEAAIARDKTKKSGRRRAERRAAIPWALSEGLALACEHLDAQLPPSRPRTGSEVSPGCPPQLSPLEPRSAPSAAGLAFLFGTESPSDQTRLLRIRR